MSNSKVVLTSDLAESADFPLDTGRHLIMANLDDGESTWPNTIKLQYRASEDFAWADTGVQLGGSNKASRQAEVLASDGMRYRVSAASAGATVRIHRIY